MKMDGPVALVVPTQPTKEELDELRARLIKTEAGYVIDRTRKYLPTLAELIDRLTIVQLKSIFIAENKAEYDKEIGLILHDIDLLLNGRAISATTIRAIAVLMLTNRAIWESESKARAGGNEQDKLLKFTHSINGVRNTAKNIISAGTGERLDLKVDSLAADLPEEYGNWRIW